MKLCILIFFVLSQFHAFSQTIASNDNFDHKIMEISGDLNKDKLPDKVIVMQDTVNEYAPYKLSIFFKDKNGEYTLIVTAINIIEPQYPEGRSAYRTGNCFSSVAITKSVLSVNYELLRGHYEHKFRFRNGYFELIGFSMVYYDGRGEMTTTNYNLLTGIRIQKTERYDADEVLSYTKKKIIIRPLPKLEDVTPFEHELY